MAYEIKAWAWQRPDGQWVVGWGGNKADGPVDKLPAAHDDEAAAKRVAAVMNRSTTVLAIG